ncbi:unnamed protein product [Dicrocoelium dendriticum]|nr:unnamed protein product [Dicrocoelium dendriticum]
MRLDFRFTNQFGISYSSGDITFTPNGYGILSPVGNQISIFDLKRDECTTLAVNSFHSIRHIAISPKIALLIAVNDAGEVSIVSLITGSVISVHSLRHPVTAVSFSPDGRFIALAKGHCVMVFFAPSIQRQINHLELYGVYYGFVDEVTSLDWSDDSSVFLAGSTDSSCRVFSLHRLKKLIVYTLSGHRNPVVGGYFQNSLDIFTVSCDGDVCIWEASYSLHQLKESVTDSNEKVLYRMQKRHRYLSTNDTAVHSLVTTTAFNKRSKMLVTGFENGSIMLHTIPDFAMITEVRLFTKPVSALSVNINVDWIGVACAEEGQLAVWEWRSETCSLKAESHTGQMTSLAYSPDGLHLATGGHDAKVKVWRIAGARAVVTFTEHTAAVTEVVFPSLKPKVVVSASLDGTVRAHDLVRYRNFRTLTVPSRLVQFASVAVDGPGSLAAAGGLDTFEAFVWSIKTGVLLATLAGHTAPISSLAFSPDVSGFGIELASVGWDGYLRLWDLSGNSSDKHNPSSMGLLKEAVSFSHDILCVTYRGDGKEIALSLLTGDVIFYDPIDGVEKGSINGKHDLGVSQTTEVDLVTPKRSAQGRKFQSIAYSADGEHLLAAGDSKYICLYSVPDRVLLKRFEVTCNLSLDGVQEVHDRRRFLASCSSVSVQAKALQQTSLPIPLNRNGPDLGIRQLRPEIRVSCIRFSPLGDSFAATTTEGVMLYSVASAGSASELGSYFGYEQGDQASWLFDAVDLDEEATPANARAALSQGHYAKALDIAIRLRIHELAEEVIESIPMDQIDFLARGLPVHQVAHFVIPFLARQLSGRSRHLGFYIHWTDSVLRTHAMALRHGAARMALAERNSSAQLQKTLDGESEGSKTPGILTERGEWAACQANLVRLQTSLEQVKANVVQRFEAVEHLWHYLESIAPLVSSDYTAADKSVSRGENGDVSMVQSVDIDDPY